jgi:hypothetical protein
MNVMSGSIVANPEEEGACLFPALRHVVGRRNETGARALRALAGVVAVLVLGSAEPAAGALKPLQFRVAADTGIRLTDVLWTGSRFLYLENTTNTIWQDGPGGTATSRFASMPNEVEETRCRLSPGAHGFARGDIYCHAPDNTIYRISSDGSEVNVFARLPEQSVSDGALAFDTAGRFGYALLAATGRSGSAEPAGGEVYAVGANGGVRVVGAYAGPGGADGMIVASRHFGAASGQVVLTVDAGSHGSILLMNERGRTRTIASLPDGPNPIVVVGATPKQPRLRVAPGLYVTDTASRHVLFAPATQFASYIGDVIVGSEIKGLFWVVRPRGRGYQTLQLPTNLAAGGYNLEGATYVTR